MDDSKETKDDKVQEVYEQNVNLSFACMVDNQKTLIEVIQQLHRCKNITESHIVKKDYDRIIKGIERIYLNEARYVMTLKGML
nr:MAG TPA: hypothetical protein [Caudoviricetes sp.]